MAKGKINPIKIILVLLSTAAIVGMTAGYFYRPFEFSWQQIAGVIVLGLCSLVMVIYAILAIRYWRTERRGNWQLFQVLSLTALTGLAVQLTGGLSSPLAIIYGPLILLTVFRSDKWKAVPVTSVLLIELGSSFMSGRWKQELPQDAATALAIILLYVLGTIMSRRARSVSVSNLPPADFNEPVTVQRELKEDLASLCGLVQAAMKTRTCAIFRADSLTGTLNMMAYKSYSAEIIKDASLEIRSSLLGWAARERQGLLYASYERDAQDLGYYRKSEPVKSVLAVPIMQESEVIGVLAVDSEQAGAFNENDKILLGGFAEEAARLIHFHHSHSALGLEKDRLQQWNSRLELMASRLRVSDVIKIIQELIPQLVPCDHVVLLEVLPEPGRARVLLSDPASAGYPAPGTEIDLSGSLSEQAINLKEWRSVDDFYRRAIGIHRFSTDERPDHGFRSVLAAPLLYEDVCHYVLVMESRQPYAFEADRDTIHIIAGQFSLALKSAAMYEEKENLAIRDGLTGLANHRRFQEYLEETITKAGSQPVGIALFDIDHFKKLNDNYGHPIGDAVLKEVAARLKKTISSFDFVARYGGEEFIAVWPGRNDKEAAQLAEQVRLAIEGEKFKTSAGDLPVTISLGAASYPQDAKKKAELIKAADEALYAAKKGGRNRVVRFAAMEKEQV